MGVVAAEGCGGVGWEEVGGCWVVEAAGGDEGGDCAGC